MDRSTLNQKAWYRALKVLFVLAFFLAQGFGFLITDSITSEKVSFVKCTNGTEFRNPYPGLGFYEFTNENDLSKRCGWQDLNSESLSFRDKIVPVNLPYTQIEKQKYLLIEKLGFYAMSFAIVSLIFWLIRRIFFYIFAKEKFLKLL